MSKNECNFLFLVIFNSLYWEFAPIQRCYLFLIKYLLHLCNNATQWIKRGDVVLKVSYTKLFGAIFLLIYLFVFLSRFFYDFFFIKHCMVILFSIWFSSKKNCGWSEILLPIDLLIKVFMEKNIVIIIYKKKIDNAKFGTIF